MQIFDVRQRQLNWFLWRCEFAGFVSLSLSFMPIQKNFERKRKQYEIIITRCSVTATDDVWLSRNELLLSHCFSISLRVASSCFSYFSFTLCYLLFSSFFIVEIFRHFHAKCEENQCNRHLMRTRIESVSIEKNIMNSWRQRISLSISIHIFDVAASRCWRRQQKRTRKYRYTAKEGLKIKAKRSDSFNPFYVNIVIGQSTDRRLLQREHEYDARET